MRTASTYSCLCACSSHSKLLADNYHVHSNYLFVHIAREYLEGRPPALHRIPIHHACGVMTNHCTCFLENKCGIMFCWSNTTPWILCNVFCCSNTTPCSLCNGTFYIIVKWSNILMQGSQLSCIMLGVYMPDSYEVHLRSQIAPDCKTRMLQMPGKGFLVT